MKSIKVKLSEKSYPVFIGEKSLSLLTEKINLSSTTKCLLILDSNVEKYHSGFLRNIFADLNCKTFKYLFKATERNKSLIEVEKIYSFLSNYYFDRNSIIISVGGGITGDISAFAASTFMRGIKYYQVPTTLLAMVDSSVGGKTGVNFNNRKNLVGTFYQPESVFINEIFLKSLPVKEILSGSGEIFKYCFLADYKNYSLLKNNLYKIFNNHTFDTYRTVESCLKIKSNIVSQDEKEITGLRKILNLGHTFAHAFEIQSNYKLKHGEAVIAGVFCALFLSENLGYISRERLDKFISDFNFIKLNKIIYDLEEKEVYQKMVGDKKNLYGKIKLVLLEDIGKIIVDVEADEALIIDSIRKMKSLI